MLTAALNKKIKRRISLWEDEVTSIVFGEMRHLPTSDIWIFFTRLIPTAQRIAINWPDDIPDKAKFRFWDRNKVEPDLSIDFFRTGEHIASLLIEIKWNSKLSPKCELVRQWADWPHKSIPTMHFYLVKDRASGQKEVNQSFQIAREQCESFDNPCCKDGDFRRTQISKVMPTFKAWQKCLLCIGWRDLLYQDKGLSSSAQEWAKGVSAFLKSQGLETFSGFHWLSDSQWNNMVLNPVLFFSKKPWFVFLNEPQELVLLPGKFLFFQGNNH